MAEGLRVLTIFLIVFFCLISIGLLFFACIHNHNGWSMFVIVPCLIAFFVPTCFAGYNKGDDHLRDSHLDEVTFKACRELGWAITVVVLLFAFCIPVLAWYNSGFHWSGVYEVFGSLLLLVTAYILWLRVFMFS